MRLAALAMIAAGLLLQGQQQMPVFRAGARLVEVSVTVLDRRGAAVTDLAAGDFIVEDEGKARAVAFFRFEGAPEKLVETAALPAGVYSNRAETSAGPARNVTALVLDALNTPAQDNMVARAQMMRYLKVLAPQTRVAVYVMGQDLRILHDFTDDPASLRARLETATLAMPLESITDFRQSVMEAEQFVNMFATDPESARMLEAIKRAELDREIEANAMARRSRRERSLAAMEALGRHLAGIPGRKNVVWISAGFSMVSVSGGMLGTTGPGRRGGVENFETIVKQTSQRLAQQGVALYIVDTKGVEVPQETTARYAIPPPERGRGRFEPQMDAERISNDPRPAMDLMASVTGGRYLYNTNDLAAGFKQTLADLRGSYTLGFYAPEEDRKWRRLRVRVKRSGLTVRHRQGYLAGAAAPQALEWGEESWQAVFANPLGSTVIPLTAKCDTAPSGEMVLTLTVEARNLHFRPEGDSLRAELQFGIADRTPEGPGPPHLTGLAAPVTAANLEEVRARGIVIRQQWKPDPGAGAVRVVVRDIHADQYGTLDIPLRKVP